MLLFFSVCLLHGRLEGNPRDRALLGALVGGHPTYHHQFSNSAILTYLKFNTRLKESIISLSIENQQFPSLTISCWKSDPKMIYGSFSHLLYTQNVVQNYHFKQTKNNLVEWNTIFTDFETWNIHQYRGYPKKVTFRSSLGCLLMSLSCCLLMVSWLSGTKADNQEIF